MDRLAFSPQVALYRYTRLVGQPFVYDFGIPSAVFGVLSDFRCLLHIGDRLKLQYDSDASTYLLENDSVGFTAENETNVMLLDLVVTCLGQCPVSTFLDTVQHDCLLCGDYLPTCTNCSSLTACSSCTPLQQLTLSSSLCASCSAYVNARCSSLNQSCACRNCLSFAVGSGGQCQLCPALMEGCSYCVNVSVCLECFAGRPVAGGCSALSGCDRVVQVYSAGALRGECIACDPGEYQPIPANGTCLCKDGSHQAGAYCTSVPGCIATQQDSDGVLRCLACNASQHFRWDSPTGACLCSDGYALAGDACAAVCGDGKVISEECDDGNTLGGDGCSSSCTVEVHYRCPLNSSLNASACQYVGPSVSIVLTETQKDPQADQGIFTFRVEPPLLLLQRFNLSDFFDFQCPQAAFSIANWTYLDGEIKLLVDYTTDLEGKPAVAIFTFDQNIIHYPPISLHFTAQSDGQLLVIIEDTLTSLLLTYLMLMTACLALLLLAVGSWFDRMVGVEAALSLQIIYYTHFSVTHYTPALGSLQELSLLGLNLLPMEGWRQNVVLSADFMRVSFSISQAEATLTLVALGLGFLLLCWGILLALTHIRPKSKGSLLAKVF
jgi:cysteine-rich repeat protein